MSDEENKSEYRIIGTDNFDRDYVGDWVVATTTSKYMGERIVKLLNNQYAEHGNIYFILVDSSYVLKRGMEDLI